MTIVREHHQTGRRRKSAHVVKILFRDRDAGPEPVKENSCVKSASPENVFQLPLGFDLHTQRPQTLGVTRENRDSQFLQRRFISLTLAGMAGDVGEFMSLGAQA